MSRDRAKNKFSNIKKMFASNNEEALRGERDIHPSMITKDDLFLSGGVFASGIMVYNQAFLYLNFKVFWSKTGSRKYQGLPV